jgi:putative transferase (TIGR04331 family)
MTLLVTTALESTWGSDEPLLFLGDWCRLYERRAAWQPRTHEVVRHHWYDRAKLAHDYEYLAALHARVLEALAVFLGKHHALERSPRYWQTLADPWLMTYVAVVFDRWENLRVALERKQRLETVALQSDTPMPPPRGYEEFCGQLVSDEWNHALFLHMLRAAYADRCTLRVVPNPAPPPAPPADAGVQRGFLARCLDRLLAAWPRRERVVLFQSYFSPRALMRLSFSLGQWPRLYLREFANPPRPAAHGPRPGFAIPFEPRDGFEEFLLKRLSCDLPASLLEEFSAFRARADACALRPDAILTASAHWGNDAFKFWAAEQVARGAKLVTLEHGGSIPPRFDTMWFEEEIADVKVTWALPTRPRQLRLPPNKIVERRRRREIPGDLCLALGLESWRYVQRATAYPVSGQTLEHFEWICRFAEALRPGVRSSFQVKPFGNQGWNTRQRFIDRLGAANVATDTNYYRLLAHARIVVCTYPNTTFSEAMSSGAPTILLYDRNLFETDAAFDALLTQLAGARIVFHDSAAAAAHVNAVWDDPSAWWSEAATREARSEFERLALDIDIAWLGKWRGFIRGVLA